MVINGKLYDLSAPKIMAILNATPDSFHAESRTTAPINAVEKAAAMLADGADIIDLGAYSTRPGAAHISADEEWQRLQPVLTAIVKAHPEAIISIDTFRAEIARKAIDCGAHIINDVSGGTLDENMFKTVAACQVPYILMHMRGTPQTMQQFTTYADVTADVINDLSRKIAQLHELGLNDIIIDPGFGFAKNLEQNYQLLNNLEALKILGLPVLVGVSRKSMINKVLGTTAKEALNGTTALHAFALERGATILRVHDVKEAKEVITLHKYLKS